MKDIKCVINYDFLGLCEDYVYWIGCIGCVGVKGVVYMFFIVVNVKYVKELVLIFVEVG